MSGAAKRLFTEMDGAKEVSESPKRTDSKKTPVKGSMTLQTMESKLYKEGFQVTSPAPSSSKGASKEASKDVSVEVDKDLEDLTDENLSKINDEMTGRDSKAKPGSYASAVKKKKELLPYCLYVQKGTERREPISKKFFAQFQKEIWLNKTKLKPSESHRIKIKWVSWRNGYGIIAALDEYTQEWIKVLACKFELESQKCRAWARWERPEATVVRGFLHGELWKEPSMKSKYVISTILEQNEFPEGTFTVLTWNASSNGIWLAFEPYGELLVALTQRLKENPTIDGITGDLTLSMSLRKERTKKEILDSRPSGSRSTKTTKSSSAQCSKKT